MSTFNFSCLRNVSGDSISEIGWIVDHPDDPDFDTRGNGYATAVIVSLFFLTGVPWNLFIICTIVKKRLYSNPTIVLLLNLAVTNFLLCILVMPLNIITGFSGEYLFGNSDAVRCHVCQTGIFVIILPCVSVHTLALMSVDRFMYLKRPLTYHHFATSRRMLLAIAILWISCTIISLPPLFGFGEIKFSYLVSTCVLHLVGRTHIAPNYYYALLMTAEILLPILVLFTMYAWILHIARKSLVYRSIRTSDGAQESDSFISESRKVQLRLVRVFVVIFTANLLTWLPLAALVTAAAIVGPGHIPTVVYNLPYLAFLSETVIHPVLEACLVREVRRLMIDSLKCS